jgi:uncharacterized protein (TIGR02284 family)
MSFEDQGLMADAGKDIEVINILITTTIDSANGFERSPANARRTQFEQFSGKFGADRRQLIARLQSYVRSLGGTPNDDGSSKANLHRRSEDLRTAPGGEYKAVIEE